MRSSTYSVLLKYQWNKASVFQLVVIFPGHDRNLGRVLNESSTERGVEGAVQSLGQFSAGESERAKRGCRKMEKRQSRRQTSRLWTTTSCTASAAYFAASARPLAERNDGRRACQSIPSSRLEPSRRALGYGYSTAGWGEENIHGRDSSGTVGSIAD